MCRTDPHHLPAGTPFYGFRISVDGTYDITSQTQVLATGQSQAIITGLNQRNTLTVIAQDQQDSFYVNGQFLASITDAGVTSLSPGFFAVDLEHLTTVAFSAVRVWSL